MLVNDVFNCYSLGMVNKVYMSNLSPVWPFAKQEALLAQAVPGWPKGATLYQDELSARSRRSHKPGDLDQRDAMLRPTGRRRGDEAVYVASLAVLAWTAEDMMEAITQAMARGATIHVLDAGLIITPKSDAATLHGAAKAFADGRRRRAAAEAGKTAGAISGQRRANMAKAAAESIRREWSLPSEEYPTLDLLRAAGISRNTAILYLGKRKVAQNQYQAGQKRKSSAFAKRGKYSL
jgi:hypothetical protein